MGFTASAYRNMVMMIPLLFPRGSSTYTHTSRQAADSMREYYASLIQERLNCDNHILKGGRLLKQYVCDVFAKIEQERFDFIRCNQDRIKAHLLLSLAAPDT